MSIKRAAIYCRISHDPSRRGAGVARQREDCLAMVAARGWSVVRDGDADTFTDNELSAYSGKRRPAYERLCQRVADGDLDVVVAWHPDRLHRSPSELEAFMDVLVGARATMTAVTAGDTDLETAQGRLHARLSGATARHASEQTQDRVRRAMLERAHAGQVHGRLRTYGMAGTRNVDGSHTWEIVEDEAAIIREVAERVISGQNLSAITRDLHERGVPTLQGKTWSRTTLRTIMVSPRIAGYREHTPGRHNTDRGPVSNGGEYLAVAEWPPILDRATSERVRRALRIGEADRRPVRGTSTLLAGLAVCKECGANLRSRTNVRGRREFVCVKPPTGRGCGRVTMAYDPVEMFVLDAIRSALADGSLAARLAERGKGDAESSWATVVALEADLTGLGEDFGQGLITRAEWLAARVPLTARLESARRDLERVQATSPAGWLTGGLVEWDRQWDRVQGPAQVDHRRAMLGQVLASVAISRARFGGRVDLERVDLTWRG